MIGIRAVNKMEAPYYLILLLILIGFGAYDTKYRRVPNKALAALFPYLLLSIPIVQSNFFGSFMGLILGGGILLTVAVITNGGVGGGDIKLTALLGLVYDAYGILLIVCIAALFAMAYGFIRQSHTRETAIHLPFVPFLTIGCCIVTAIKLI